MIREVRALSGALEDYPKRQEVHEKYVSRRESRQRLVLVFAFAAISLVFSYFVTISTVSTCFLGGDGNYPGLCKMIPGYEEAQTKNDEILQQFRHLVEMTERNDKRLDRIERIQP